jgi:hypothetical protein
MSNPASMAARRALKWLGCRVAGLGMARPKPVRPRRRLAPLLLAGVAGSLWGAACGLDERVLTAPPSPPGSGVTSCGEQGSTACETCLYRDCCEQAQVCGEGSSCATYLTCVAGCGSVERCVDACAINSPSGFGDAVALSTCARTQCSACFSQAPAIDSCDPTGSGACDSSNDCALLEQGVLRSLDVASCPECTGDVVGQSCQRCLAGQTGLSGPCSSCMAQLSSCLTDYCLLSCQPEAAGGCDQCLLEAGCTPQLAACAFGG